ncbi:MAG: hypothetical protein Q7R65_03700 [bacterium]|nr:hypothetical protein [bacterium]
MNNQPHESFRVTSIETADADDRKWWQFTKMSRKELGQTAIIGILGGGILSNSTDLLVRAFGTLGLLLSYVLGSLLAMMGLAAAILWLYKVIRRK